MRKLKFLFSIVLFLQSVLFAASIAGGSELLTQGYANQLETWLGEGNITITKIYSKQSGHTAANFHSAVDGQGRTFSIIEVLKVGTTSSNKVTDYQIVGGYNPQSWNSSGNYNYTYNDNDRTAFLFNLTKTNVGRLHQKKDTETNYYYQGTSYGYYQTYNHSSYGPYFSAWDLRIDDYAMTTGFSHLYGVTYGADNGQNMNVVGQTNWDHSYLDIGKIEVFTISQTPIPEPGSILCLMLGLLSFICYRKKL